MEPAAEQLYRCVYCKREVRTDNKSFEHYRRCPCSSGWGGYERSFVRVRERLVGEK